MIDKTDLTIERLGANDAAPLGAFFQVLAADPETVRFFHPHPLTVEFAHELCRRQTHARDRFYVARYRGHMAGYLMLRGWEEGFAVPSFGGCVHPAFRGRGLGKALLAHAIQEARALAAPRLRLTVYKANARAVHVYRKFGFAFREKNEHELIGLLEISPDLRSPAQAVEKTELPALS
ncbi:MAG TPA: GNAT family N-acetyltransferase [Gemmataceae bacterium]|jgi:ribosomal-protein-alanine N-acetyltransferase|nr:GNAT family N-acetyltransferase [Gemmataceae bacterium]